MRTVVTHLFICLRKQDGVVLESQPNHLSDIGLARVTLTASLNGTNGSHRDQPSIPLDKWPTEQKTTTKALSKSIDILNFDR